MSSLSHPGGSFEGLWRWFSVKKREFFQEVVWSGEVRVVVAAPFEVCAHGVDFCEFFFLLGFCGVLEFVWSGFVSS